jgi:hypothetical protein
LRSGGPDGGLELLAASLWTLRATCKLRRLKHKALRSALRASRVRVFARHATLFALRLLLFSAPHDAFFVAIDCLPLVRRGFCSAVGVPSPAFEAARSALEALRSAFGELTTAGAS